MTIIRFLGVGLVAGWVLGKIRRGRGYGFFGNIFIGAVGSFIGWFLMGFLKVETSNLPAQMAMAVVGSVVFFLVIGMFRWKRRKKSKEDDDE